MKEHKIEDSQAANYHWDFKVDIKFIMNYIAQCVSWIRLCMIEEPNGFNGAEYWATKVLIFDSLKEDWPIEESVGFTGQDLYGVLSTKLDADFSCGEYQRAYKCIWKVLASSSMQKITHGKNLMKTPALGSIWDEAGHEEDDIAPGTFAELLRYGSVHLEQDRETIEYRQAPRVPSEMCFKKGILEP